VLLGVIALGLYITCGVRTPKLDPEKSQWMVIIPSGFEVLMPLVGVRVPKLDPKKELMGGHNPKRSLSPHITRG